MALTRLLTPTSYGIYGLAGAVIALTGTVFFDWHAITFLRFSDQRCDKHDDPVGTFVFLFLGLILLTGFLFGLVYICGLAQSYGSVLLAGLIGGWAVAWFQFVARIQMAQLHPGRTFWMNSVRVLTTLIMSLAVAYCTRDPIYVVLAMAAGQISGSVLYPLRGFSLSRASFDRPLAEAALIFGSPIALGLTLSGVGVSISRFMLDQLASTEAVGRFTAGSLAVQSVLALLSIGIGQAIYPLAVKAVESGDHLALRRQLTQNFAMLLGTLMPGAVGLALITQDLAPLLVGRDFVAAVVTLTPWLAAAALLGGLRAQHFDYSFQLGRRTSYLVMIQAITTALNIGLNFLLIPRYGEQGAAMALVIALLPSLLLAKLLSRRVLDMPTPLKLIMQIAFACLVMAAAIEALPGLPRLPALFAKVSVGGAAYITALIALDVMGVRTHALEALRRIARAIKRSPYPWLS